MIAEAIDPTSPPDAIAEEEVAAVPYASLAGFTMLINTVNGKDHLKHLKRTGGGVGSSKFDDKQKTIESFFKR